jgi:hypothetical protein
MSSALSTMPAKHTIDARLAAFLERDAAFDGTLVGYAGGTRRKQWLLEHEQRA